MIKRVDAALDGITMYRLTLYVLLGILGVAVGGIVISLYLPLFSMIAKLAG